MNRRWWLLCLLLAAHSLGAEDQRFSWQGPNQPLYVVTRNHYAEGFTESGPTAKLGDLIMIEIYRPDNQLPQKSDYRIGSRHNLFWGGERRGSVKIEKVVPLLCDSFTAIISASSLIPSSSNIMALATNASGIGSHESVRRVADAKEYAYAGQLAMQEFRKHGVTNGSTKDISIKELVATRVKDGEPDILIGSFYFTTKTAKHHVFLIGRLGGTKPLVEFAQYQETTDLEDEKDLVHFRLVDQLDLDRDGIDEIVLEITGYEGEEFEIYKRIGGFWKKVWEGGQGGC